MNDDDNAALGIAKRLGIPYASRANKILVMQKGEGLEIMVPEAFAREDLVLPLFVDGKVLAVAMAAPADQDLIDRLKRASGLEIQPFVAAESELLLAIDESYARRP